MYSRSKCCDAYTLSCLQGLIIFSRVGVYMRLPGVDAERFAETVQSGGILGYIDALSGGSISRVGIFSLGALTTTQTCFPTNS